MSAKRILSVMMSLGLMAWSAAIAHAGGGGQGGPGGSTFFQCYGVEQGPDAPHASASTTSSSTPPQSGSAS